MIKPISAVKTQHVPQFGGIFGHPVEGAKKVVHKGVTAHITGNEAELLDKWDKDDRASSPKGSAKGNFLDYIADVVLGRPGKRMQEWDEVMTGDIFNTGSAQA